VTDKPVLWHNPEDIYDITTIYDPEYHQGWTPLYTSPPSVEAAIEATKEKAAKVCEEYGNSVNNDWNKQLGVADDLVSIAEECAAAIRSMK
jgi:hypothetical protein